MAPADGRGAKDVNGMEERFDRRKTGEIAFDRPAKRKPQSQWVGEDPAAATFKIIRETRAGSKGRGGIEALQGGDGATIIAGYGKR